MKIPVLFASGGNYGTTLLLALTISDLREENADVCLTSIALIVIMKMTGDKAYLCTL